MPMHHQVWQASLFAQLSDLQFAITGLQEMLLARAYAYKIHFGQMAPETVCLGSIFVLLYCAVFVLAMLCVP